MKKYQHYLGPVWLAILLLALAPNLTFANGTNLTYAECVKRCNAQNTTLLQKEMCRNACRANCDKSLSQLPERHVRIGDAYDQDFDTDAIYFPFGQIPGLSIYLFQGEDIIPCSDPTINWTVQEVAVVSTDVFVNNDLENVPWQQIQLDGCSGMGIDAFFDPALFGTSSFMVRAVVFDPDFGILEAYNSLDFSNVVEVNHAGNEHATMGQANLTDNNGMLTVSNIGSSGQDGVSIDLGEVSGVSIGIESVNLNSPGQELRLGLMGFVNDDPLPHSVAGLTITPDPNGLFDNNLDFGVINTTQTTFEAYDSNGNLVHSWVGGNGYNWQSNYLPSSYYYCWWRSWYWPWRCYWGWGYYNWWYWRYWNWWYWPRYWYWSFSYYTPTTLVVDSPTGPQSFNDIGEIRVSVETDDNVTGGFHATATATNVNDFSLGNERLIAFGNFHQALGAATVDADDGDLVISNIGSSGQDGVNIELADPAQEFQLNWDPLVPAGASSGVDFHFDFGSTPPIPIFMTYDGLQSSVGGDFTGRSPAGYHLDFFNDGQAVNTYSGLNDPFQLVVDASPVGLTVGTRDDLMFFDIYYEIASPATLVEQGATFPITNVRITIPMEFAPGGISGVNIMGRDLEGIDLNNEFATTERAALANFDLTVFLGSAYDASTGLMKSDLNTQGLLPAVEPYFDLGLRENGGEFITPNVLQITGQDAMVDWVLVELRDAVDPSIIVSSRAGILQRSGHIVDLDGRSALRFLGELPPGISEAYVAIRHRSHLGIMTAAPVSLTGDVALDFTDGSVATFGTNAQSNNNGVNTMIAGNANGDGTVRYNGANNDKNAILGAVGLATPNDVIQSVYDTRDVNMDGNIRYNGANNDKNAILFVTGLATPNNVINEQLP